MSRTARDWAARTLVYAALALGLLDGGPWAAKAAGGERPVAAAPAVSAQSAAGATSPAVDGDRQILHTLSRLTYGPRPGDLERVRAMGLSAWIDRQALFGAVDDFATERALAELPTLRMPITELLREFPRPDPKMRARDRQR